MVCQNCGDEFERNGNAQRYCSKKCQREYKMDICSNYNKLGKISLKQNNLIICNKCYQYYHKDECNICKNIKEIVKRDENNKPICKYCYEQMKKKEICSICKIDKRVAVRNKDGIPICGNCNKDICSICGQNGLIYSRDQKHKPICNKCHRNFKKEICCQCLKLRIVQSRNINNQSICNNCYRNLNREKCMICNNYHRVNMRYNNQSICFNCSELLKKLNNDIEKTKKFKINKKSFHHKVFEELFEDFESEYSISRLISEKIYLKYNNGLLRYDYYSKKRNILVELNEPSHYSWDEYNKNFPKRTLEKFYKYCQDFETKVQLAQENKIDLIIIDVNYKMNYDKLKILYLSKIPI